MNAAIVMVDVHKYVQTQLEALLVLVIQDTPKAENIVTVCLSTLNCIISEYNG